MTFIYGFYKVNYEEVPQRILLARSMGIRHFDTAQLYGNERCVAENCHADESVATKIYAANTKNHITSLVKKSLRRFGNHAIDTMLLHRVMPHELWQELSRQPIKCKGVSNYDTATLQDLVAFCDANNIPRPDVIQIEMHPFVDCLGLVAFCQKHNIRVQAHTVLCQGKLLNYPGLTTLAEKYAVSPATVLTNWALSKGVDVCLNSKSEQHLQQLMSRISLQPVDLNEMDTWHVKAPHRFFHRTQVIPLVIPDSENQELIVDKIVSQIQADMTSVYPSIVCEQVPLCGESYRTIGRQISAKLFPDMKPETALSKYRALMKSMRTQRIQQAKMAYNMRKGLTCCVVRRTQGEYSESIMHPKPMPVDVADPEEFVPFFEYLTRAESAPAQDVVFVRGAVFPDGRMDLCKQVVGPTSLRNLCETVNKSKIVRHFLLGNNVALQQQQVSGAEAFSSVMRNPEQKIRTWYLAGNCIGPEAVQIMAEALTNNQHCEALWLKRNPVGPLGATYLNQMLSFNRTIRLLDLHNCALGTEGINCLLQNPENLTALRHLYIDANGIESTQSVAAWIKVGNPVTIYFSINRLGDKEIQHLASALTNNSTIKRLCLSSTHMNNAGLRAIVDMSMTCPKLRALNLGCYKSTSDLGEHPGNFFDNEVIGEIARLLTQNPYLKYLNISGCQISTEGMLSLPESTTVSFENGKTATKLLHNKQELRFLKQPKRVVDIDSIYRGKM